MRTIFILLLITLQFTLQSQAAPEISITDYARSGINQWQHQTFVGQNQYQIISEDGQSMLQARSKGGASGLSKEIKIDLSTTPFLNWRWKIDKRLGTRAEKEKSGDDFGARIYLIIKHPWLPWKTRALNYVWSDNQLKGESWPSPYVGDNVKIQVVRSFEDPLGSWQQEKRNVYEDLKKQFGEDIRYIHAIGLMTDTDNSQTEALSYYGEIFFSDK